MQKLQHLQIFIVKYGSGRSGFVSVENLCVMSNYNGSHGWSLCYKDIEHRINLISVQPKKFSLLIFNDIG